ncbi:hypothetical protein Tco_0726051 [Tanacetum coccineum]|uniref:Uncharacterized protein n=1 Tax=Tanacetum coccineum TaxID=301880 RepID=A0ABQ4YEL1_9ASTR
MYLRGRGKIDYLTSETKEPPVKETSHAVWDAENNMVMPWHRMWQDLDLFNDYEWKCIEDSKHFKNLVEKNRIYKFLAGLDVEYDEVRGRILGKQPLPPIGEVFSEVRSEESRRSVMLGKKGDVTTVESSALAAGSSNSGRAFPTANEVEHVPTFPFSKEQMDQLKKLLATSSTSG